MQCEAQELLTGEVVVDVQDAAVADQHGRALRLAGSDGGHCDELAWRAWVGCDEVGLDDCSKKKMCWGAGVCVVLGASEETAKN